MNRRGNAIALSLALTLITSQSAFAAAKTSVIIKKVGRAATVIPNTILSGSGVPVKSIGIDGDFYIDIKNANLYGPKTKGVWKLATSLRIADTKDIVIPTAGVDGVKGDRGPQGLTGADGAKGATGATGLTGAVGATGNTGATGLTGASGPAGAIGPSGGTGLTGATGATGIVGVKGDTGAAGAAGAAGATGPAGSAGASGAAGSPGAKGDPGTAGTDGVAGAPGVAGTNGVKGDTGLTGGAGVKGDTGLTGTKGDTGLTGAAGISNAKSSSIIFSGNLPGSAGSTKASDSFGTFVAGGSYIVRILINTFDANSTLFTYGLGLSLSTSGDIPVISFNYSVIYGSVYSGGNRSMVAIIADVVLSGALTSNPYLLIATLTSGANGGASISASGTCTQILVGAIG